MTELTYYHNLISKCLNDIQKINIKINPLIDKYNEEFKEGDVKHSTLKNLLVEIDNVKEEYEKIDKLIRDIQEDAKGYYEDLVWKNSLFMLNDYSYFYS